MNEDRRREIPEWVTWLALALLFGLAPLPFVTEENAERIFRALPLAAMFIFPLIMLFATMLSAEAMGARIGVADGAW